MWVGFGVLGFYQLSIHKVWDKRFISISRNQKNPQRLQLPFKYESQDTITRLSIIFIDYFI